MIERRASDALSEQRDKGNHTSAPEATVAGIRSPVEIELSDSGRNVSAYEDSHRRRLRLGTRKYGGGSVRPGATIPAAESRFLSDRVELPRELFTMESCHSTWIFDPVKRRYRRVLKGIELRGNLVMTDWHRYYRLDLDRKFGSFVVWLNAGGTQVLRARRHTKHCEQCDQHTTAKVSLHDIRSAVQGSRVAEQRGGNWLVREDPNRPVAC